MEKMEEMEKKELGFGRKILQHIKSEKGFGVKEIAVAVATVVIVGLVVGIFKGKADSIFNYIWEDVIKGIFNKMTSN